MTTTSPPISLALAAMPRTRGRYVEVGARVRVTRWAMGDVDLGSDAAKQVLSLRDRLQVRRVHARSVATQMVHDQASVDWFDELLVQPSVGRDAMAVPVAEPAIAIPSDVAEPQPAAVIQPPHLRPESLDWRRPRTARRPGLGSWTATADITGTFHASVMRIATVNGTDTRRHQHPRQSRCARSVVVANAQVPRPDRTFASCHRAHPCRFHVPKSTSDAGVSL